MTEKLPYKLIRFDQSGNYAGYVVSPKRVDVDGYTYFAVDAPPSNPVLDGDSWREMTEQEIADITEQKEAERIAGLAATHGTMVGRLVAALDAFNITLPTDIDTATETMFNAVSTDASLEKYAILALAVYNSLLSSNLTDNDIYKISLVIQG